MNDAFLAAIRGVAPTGYVPAYSQNEYDDACIRAADEWRLKDITGKIVYNENYMRLKYAVMLRDELLRTNA